MNDLTTPHTIDVLATWTDKIPGLTSATAWTLENLMTLWCVFVLIMLLNTLRWIASVRNGG